MVKRSVININLASPNNEYAFIDCVKGGTQIGGPNSQATWKTGDVWMQKIDANGWPTYTGTKTSGLGGFYLPTSSNFAGPYTIDGRGTGRVALSQGTWTLGAATGVTQASNGTYNVTDTGSGWTAQLTYSGTHAICGLNVTINTTPIHDVRFYRTADAPDLAAGKIFRSAWKQTLVDLNPYAIRVMNWAGGANSKVCRFENRTLPSYAEWQPSGYNWSASLPYGETTGTNQIVLGSVTGTPASMQHGEIATCRVLNDIVRVGAKTVTAITKAAAGVATVTATAHGFNTSDKIVHIVSAGMTQLDMRPCTIVVSDADHYTIDINTTSFTTFTAGVAEQFITLQVGSGSNRTAYPVVFPDGTVTAGHYGAGYIVAGDYKTFYFDKNHAGQKDASGNWVTGVWIFNDNGPDKGHQGGTPYEAGSALINELMAMTRSDGGAVGPIDLWVCLPHWALLSMDPDHSTASNGAIGMVDVILNGSTVDGVTYDGLHSSCKLYVEFCNETWNSAGGFYATLFVRRLGFLRWPASGTTDNSSMSMLRSMIMVQDILGASQSFPRNRLKFVIGGQGTIGVSAGNSARIDGSAYVLADPLNPDGDTPMSVHDYFAFGGYFEPSSAFNTANLTTLAASWGSHAGDLVAQEADCAGYVVGLENTGVTASGNETLYRYREALLPSYASAMVALGKETLMYEGGWNKDVTNGTADVNNYLKAVKRSRAWANAWIDFLNKFDTVTGAVAPSDYLQLDERWGHLYPDSYNNNVDNVEWSGLDLAWKLAALRNCEKRQFLVKT